jgi:hypothetical protein
MSVQKIARLFVVSGFLFLPATAWAQAATGTIAGVVKDPSGAVMPGVTVEAASPALIERVRAVVSDGQGLYRIVDLRPGTYTVTFTLAGFSTFKREGIDLTSGFTASVNGELKVGSLEETVTVTGEASLVDTQNIHQQTTLTRETLDALPTSRRQAQLVQLILGANPGSTQFHDVGGVGSDRGEFGVHNQRTADMTYNFGGIDSRTMSGGSMPYNIHIIQEQVVETAAGTAESTTGGVQVNMIPKDGGNRFSGSFSTENTSPSMQSGNLTDSLRKRGLNASTGVKMYTDFGGGLGGPIKKDRLWFYYANRKLDRGQYVQGDYYNKLPQPTVLYVPDLNHPGWTHDYSFDTSVRFTWQVAQKHKIAIQHSQQPSCQCTFGILDNQNPTIAPEAAGEHHYDPQYLSLLQYTYPVTNRFLLEVYLSRNSYHRNQTRQTTAADAVTGYDAIAVVDNGLNLNYNSRQSGYQQQNDDRNHERVAMSYVTGSHNFKAGFDGNQFFEGRPSYDDVNRTNRAISYGFRNQVPQNVSVYSNPTGTYLKPTENAVYAQDQWTIRNLTTNLGLRYSVYDVFIPAFHLPAGPYVPARDFPEVEHAQNYKNLSPRLGVAYDLFGDGKTALKWSLGRYSARNTGTAVNVPVSNQALSVTRNWNDSTFGVGDSRTGNFVPDCDLTNPLVNGECAQWQDLTFGRVRAGNTVYADDAISGLNNQLYNWQTSVSVQHELRPGLALNVGYYRTWYGGFLATDNQLVTPANYDQYCITAPTDNRLPTSGQQLCGLYDLTPTLLGQVNNLVTQASHYGKQTDVYNGVDVNFTSRFGRGGQFQGGVTTGRHVTDNCFVVDSPQQNRDGFCHVREPLSSNTQVKFSVVYPLPWSFNASAVYQNLAGFPILTTYVPSNAEIKPSLGRNLAACPSQTAATCTSTPTAFDIVTPNTMFDERVKQLDVRFNRIFRLGNLRGLGNARLRLNLDVYNLFNANTILNENTRYSLTNNQWQNALQIMGGRLFKVSAQFDF